jgi:hypothetical protein
MRGKRSLRFSFDSAEGNIGEAEKRLGSWYSENVPHGML